MITEEYIKKILNRCYPQEGLCMVPRKAINYSNEIEGGWYTINEILNNWEMSGLIKILKNAEFAEDDEVCIELLMFLDGNQFPPNWIRDRPTTSSS